MGVYSRQLRPRLHDRLLDDAATSEVRDRVCAGLAGDVLEIGFGSGLNLAHLPSAVPVELAGDDAQALPFPDDRFDAALCTWVLCSVPDRGRALAGSPLTVTELTSWYLPGAPRPAGFLSAGRATA